MEFERAIFRVYERCVEGLRDDDNEVITSKSCRIIEALTFFLATFFLFTLFSLHFTFVGHSRCLPQLLQMNGLTGISDDSIFQITLDNQLSPDGSGAHDVSYQDGSVSPYEFLLKNRRYRYYNIFNKILNIVQSSNITNVIDSTLVPNPNVTAYYDYEFTFNIGELVLPDKIRKDHDFKIINMTMSSDLCFGNSPIHYLLPLGGMDTVIINDFMYTFHKSGHLITANGDYYHWTKKDTQGYSSYEEWIIYKIYAIFLSVFVFFLLSTSTALLVRVLISSGVVLLLPIFYLFQLCGIRVVTSQIIRLSYPWIGIPLEMLRARNQSTFPFILAHITRVVIYYVFYEACQMTFGLWFYGQQEPGQRELWLFATMMLWEYFGMIYVRSRSSIQLFPRAIFCLFLIYHFYLYLQPFGFHILALLVMFMYSSCVMIYCVRKYELEAYYRGLINIDRPRMIYNTVVWPTWSMALAPDFTLFLPVTQHAVDIYTNPIPSRDIELGNVTGQDRNEENQRVANTSETGDNNTSYQASTTSIDLQAIESSRRQIINTNGTNGANRMQHDRSESDRDNDLLLNMDNDEHVDGNDSWLRSVRPFQSRLRYERLINEAKLEVKDQD